MQSHRVMPATMLIADDHESSLAGLQALLQLEGYQVVSARDGETAFSEFERVKPDLLLLAVDMPGMRGTAISRRIKSNPNTMLVPIVLITGLTALEHRLLGIEVGADEFQNQPVRPDHQIAWV